MKVYCKRSYPWEESVNGFAPGMQLFISGQTYEAFKIIPDFPDKFIQTWYHVKYDNNRELFSSNDFEDYFLSEAQTRKLKLEKILKN